MFALIVEDSEPNYVLFREILKPKGWTTKQVVMASDVESAIAESNPDIVVMDISLPDGDGLEMTRQLRVNGYQRPIVVLSAHNYPGIEEKALRSGANAFFSKPCDLYELENIITKVTLLK